jgi:hypothetical protein
LAFVLFGTVQRVDEVELPLLLMDRVRKHILMSGCVRRLQRSNNEVKKPRTEQLFGCNGIAYPSFCYHGRGHRHRAKEFFGTCEGFDDQVCAFIGSDADPGTQLDQRLTRIEAVKKKDGYRGIHKESLDYPAVPFLRFRSV